MIRIKNGDTTLKGNFLELSSDLCTIMHSYRDVCSELGIDADEAINTLVQTSKMTLEELRDYNKKFGGNHEE